jgi:hypothetical protein
MQDTGFRMQDAVIDMIVIKHVKKFSNFEPAPKSLRKRFAANQPTPSPSLFKGGEKRHHIQ